MKKWLVLTLLALVFISTADAADPLMLRVTAETQKTITFAWDPVAGAAGFKFYRDGTAVSITGDINRTTVRFSKTAVYKVCPLFTGDTVSTKGCGTYPATPPPPPPPPPSGNSISLTGTFTPTAFAQAIGSTRPLTVLCVCTVTGALAVPSDVTISGVTVQGTITLGNKSTFKNSSAVGFDVTSGADNWTLADNVFDGQKINNQNLIWDAPGGNGSSGWVIRGNTFRNYYVASDPSSHAEAIYVGGYSSDGLIDGNTFTNNGNTAHVFFTWFGSTADPARSYPRNICVRNNVFNATWTAYFSIDWRSEIPSTANIRVAPSNVQAGPQALTSRPEFNASC